MNVVIIEDEKRTAQRLENLLLQYDPTIRVLAKLSSVAKSLAWFAKPTSVEPDLLFLDIHLDDGSGFQFLEQAGLTLPIIFTTAYDQYAIQAFKTNSIDYLLKPIDIAELARGIDKFKRLQALQAPTVIPDDMKDAIEATKLAEKRRLLQEQETLSTELKALKAQVNPHFLYNTLNYFYIKAQEVDTGLAESIIKLAEIMRYSMSEDFNTAELSEEIDYMRQFISLHQMRHTLHLRFTVTGDVETKTILPFLLIGLVENAFKHGNLTNPDHPFVINLAVFNDRIEFFTSNLKNKKPRFDSNHIGLSNTRKRLDRAYPHYTFKVNNETDVFSCNLIIYNP